MGKRGNIRSLLWGILILGAFLFLACHFFNNRWQLNPYDPLYRNWQLDSEELVVNKILDARSHGIGNYNGMMLEYQQQIGFAGMLFSGVDKLVNRHAGLTDPIPKDVMCGVNVFLFTVILFLFFCWIYREFGKITVGVVYLTTLFTHWMGFTVKNLYWVTWTMLLPMASLLLLLMWEERRERCRNGWLFGLSFFFVFLRSACGYEFISCVMVALELPLVYYGIKQRWGWKRYRNRAFLAGLGALGGFGGALFVNIALMAGLHGWKDAVEYLVFVSAKRTGYASLEGFDADVLASFEVPLLEVFRRYLQENNGYAIFVRWNLDVLIPVFLLAAAATVFVWRMRCRRRKVQGFMGKQEPVEREETVMRKESVDRPLATQEDVVQRDLRMLGLNAMMAVSLLGPVSWLVLAKGHAVHHQHIDYIIFSLPFTMLGFASVAYNVLWHFREGLEGWGGNHAWFLTYGKRHRLVVPKETKINDQGKKDDDI